MLKHGLLPLFIILSNNLYRICFLFSTFFCDLLTHKNPYTGKKINLGLPYIFEGTEYYSLNLVSKALTAHDGIGVELGLGLFPSFESPGGNFDACSTGDSELKSGRLGEEFHFTYPNKDNTTFETSNGEIKLFYHKQQAAYDNIACYAYISLETIREYMLKDGYFTDLNNNGVGVWSFKATKPSINIITPKQGDSLRIGDIIVVEADIDRATYANLVIGDYTEIRSDLNGKKEVKFNDYTLPNKGANNLTVKVEVGNSIYHNTDVSTVQLWIEDEENKDTKLVSLEQLDMFGFYMGNNESERKNNIDELNNLLYKYDITSNIRIAFFMGQVKKESRSGSRTLEGFNGNDPESYFNEEYSNRADLGNLGGDDGQRFRGAGYIQLTGRYNYEKFANDENVNDPIIISEGYKVVGGVYNRPVNEISYDDKGVIDVGKYAWEASGWFWKKGNPHHKDLNEYADIKNWQNISEAINKFDTATFLERNKYINEFFYILEHKELGLPEPE